MCMLDIIEQVQKHILSNANGISCKIDILNIAIYRNHNSYVFHSCNVPSIINALPGVIIVFIISNPSVGMGGQSSE